MFISYSNRSPATVPHQSSSSQGIPRSPALSSSLNYTLNRRYVFGGSPQGRTVLRYYCLWFCQLLCGASVSRSAG